MAAMAGGVSGRKDPFPGPAPVPRDRVKRFLRGSEEKAPRPAAPRLRRHLKHLETGERCAAEKAARWEPLLPEEPGFLEADPGQDSSRISQQEIQEAVDISSASKHFELRLEQFGPYRLDYTRNGRHLLLGGLRGHVAALDWEQRRLLSEFSTLEPLRDLCWLHTESLLAVAQQRWLHVYDCQGLELHVLKGLQGILRLQFLPFHFLLAAVSSLGLLHFLDVSVGREVAALRTRSGRAGAMAQNPASGLIHLGHSNGTVSLWSPAQAGPVLRLLAHRGGVRGVAVDGAGRLMATSGLDRRLRIFDLRGLGVLREWGLPLGASELHFSQRGLLGAASGDLLQIFPKLDFGDPGSPPRPFLQHRCPSPPRGLQFCPFQDVLGAGHGLGFSSILVPGAGEPNLDALENNPYRSRRQRQEWEVKALLEKVPWELLTPDPDLLSRVDTAGLEQKHQERIQRLGFDPQAQPRFRFRSRRRRGRDPERSKRQLQSQRRRAEIKKILEEKEKNEEEPPKKKRKKIGEEPPKIGKKIKKTGKEIGGKSQKIGKKNGAKPQKNQEKIGKKSQEIGEKTGEKTQQSQEKIGKKAQKVGGKLQKIGQKNGEKTQKTGEEIGDKLKKIGPKNGEKIQKNQEKFGAKPQKNQEKIGKKTPKNQEKIGGKSPKIGGKSQKNWEENGGDPQEAAGGGRGPESGGRGPEIGGPGEVQEIKPGGAETWACPGGLIYFFNDVIRAVTSLPQ